MFCQRIRVNVDSFLRYFIIVDLKQNFKIFLYLDEAKRVNNLYLFDLSDVKELEFQMHIRRLILV